MLANTDTNRAAKTTPVLLAISLLALTVAAIFGAYFAAAAPATTAPAAGNITVTPGISNLINITVSNNVAVDGGGNNINTNNVTNVTVTFPANFSFVSPSTNASPAFNATIHGAATFANTSPFYSNASGWTGPQNQTFINVSWNHATMLIGGNLSNSFRYFWFNITVPATVDDEYYNISVVMTNASANAIQNVSNITIYVNDTTAPRLTFNTSSAYPSTAVSSNFIDYLNLTSLGTGAFQVVIPALVIDATFNMSISDSGGVMFNLTMANTTRLETGPSAGVTSNFNMFNSTNSTGMLVRSLGDRRSAQLMATQNWTNLTLPNGRYELYIIANDSRKNVNITKYTITIDNQTPTNLTFAGDTEVTQVNVSHPWILINLSAADQGLSGIANMTYNIWNVNSSGGTYKSVNATLPIALTNQTTADGVYDYNVTVTDFAGNVNYSATRRITIDTTVPLVVLTSNTTAGQPNYGNISRGFITVEVISTDTNFNSTILKVFNSSGLNTTAFNLTRDSQNKTYYNITGLIDGLYTFNVTVIDYAGNVNVTAVRTVTLDNQVPTNLTFAGDTAADGVNVTHPWIAINLSAADQGLAGVANMTYNIWNGNSTGGIYKSVNVSFPIIAANLTVETDGTYYYNVTVTDFAGNVNYSATRKIKINSGPTTSPSSSGGGAGGGGGGGAGLATATAQGFVFTTVTGNTPVTNAVTNTQIGVTEVTFELNTNANDVRLDVSKLADKPAEATSTPSGTAYRYLEVKVSGVDEAAIKSGTIKFTVDKSWVTTNGANKDTVTLNRWANSQWNALATKLTGETDTMYAYEATTPGFSVFAVTATVAGAAAPSATTGGKAVATTPGTSTSATSRAQLPAGTSSKAMWIIVAIIVIAAVVGYAMKRKGRKW